MQLRDQYDWVVLGDDPGALLSAGLAARLGLSVLAVPAGTTAHRSVVSKTGQVLDPEPNFFLGLSRASTHPGLLAEGLGKLGIVSAEEELIQSQDCLPQIVTPEYRIELASEAEGLEHVFRREMGLALAERLGLLQAYRAAERDYLRYWNELPDRLTLSPDGKPKSGTLRLKDFRARLVRGSSLPKAAGDAAVRWLREEEGFSEVIRLAGSISALPLLHGVWRAVIGNPEKDPEAATLLQALILAKTGASFRGGSTAFREFLIRVAKRHGVHFPEKPCRRIFIDNGRVTGVQLEQKGNMIGARGVALGCGTRSAEGLMNRSGKSWLIRKPKKTVPVGWRYTLSLSVHEEAISPGFGNRVLWQEPGAPSLEIEVAPPQEYGIKSARHCLIFLRTILPFSPGSLCPKSLRMVSARMLRQAKELLPFLEYHIVSVFPDFRGEGFEEEVREYYSFRDLEGIPENLLCYVGKGIGVRGGAEGLFVISNETYPELGSMGPSVAALESVAWIAHRSGLPGPLA